MDDRDYMLRAIALAKKGVGWTNPNPMVGAVIVKNGRVIGEGYHQRCGELHAERNALAARTESAEGATLYVTLEPCCHYGRTPPCTQAILEHKIARVVIGSRDPNPLVAGKGAQMLREQGVIVEQDVLRAECDAINPVFFHYITTGRPYVVMKYAMTLDGKIATCSGKSKWITGEAAREQVHRDRSRYRGIMAGVGTILADDPMLNCRVEGGRDPVRVICDSHLRTPLTSRIVATAREIPTILATVSADKEAAAPYEAAGCRVWTLPERGGRPDLTELMRRLGAEGIDSVLLEGGGTLNWTALESGIVNRVQAYIAPKLFGGAGAKSPVGGQGVEDPAGAVRLRDISVRRLGGDILLEGEVESLVHGNS